MTLQRSDEDPSFPRLAALQGIPPQPAPPGAPKVLFISLYCYKSFPVRGFHALARQSGVDSHALFLKNNFTNHHKPISDREMGLLAELVTEIRPDLVAISVLTPYVPAARKVIAAIRGLCDAVIIAGGKHPTISPDEALTYADYVCKGEGELVLLDIFDRLARGSRDFGGIDGLWHRDGDGRPVDMGQRRLIQNLDMVPFEAYGEPQMYFIEHDGLETRDPELDEEEILVMAGRGCVYQCSYCVNALLIPLNRGNGRFVRLRSPDGVIAQVRERLAKQAKASIVSFNDEVFGVFDDWTAEFAAKYRDLGLPRFNCELVPKLIKERNIAQLVNAGLYEMHFGIQSGSDHIRNDVLKRPGKNDELIEKAAMLARLGVQVQCDLILNNPFDDAAVMAETLALLGSMPQPLKLNIYKLQFFPHYPLTEKALAAGIIGPPDIAEDVVANNTMYNFVYRPSTARWDRKSVLENCVYLIPWNNPLVWWLARSLAKGGNPLLAAMANGLAYWRYQLDFRAAPLPVLLRRVWIVGRMLARGDVKPLMAKLRQRLWLSPGRARP